jgi:hypothetical protein
MCCLSNNAATVSADQRRDAVLTSATTCYEITLLDSFFSDVSSASDAFEKVHFGLRHRQCVTSFQNRFPTVPRAALVWVPLTKKLLVAHRLNDVQGVGNANFARLLRGYLLGVPGLVFRFALPLILDANGQASAHIHFVDEPRQRTTI